MPERSAWWPARRTLLVADLHVGKCESMRVQGAPIPDGVLQADLQRLAAAAARVEATRIIVVGDLLHASIGLTEQVRRVVSDWRRQGRIAAVEILVVPGNHDRRLRDVADAWDLAIAPPALDEPPFAFAHDPAAARADAPFTWCGHVHPAASLRAGADRLKLPCFWIGPRIGVLPAFSRFTSGAGVRPSRGERLIAVTPEGLLPLG